MEKNAVAEDVKKIDEVVNELLANSTIHALPQVFSSKRIKTRIFWSCVLATAIGLFGVQLNGLLKEYNSNPKQTTIRMQSGTLKFPAITLCNMNTFKESTLGDKFPNDTVEEMMFNYGHKFEDLMYSSQFAGKEENVTYKRYWVTRFGNCFTIDSPKYETSHSGPLHGFELALNLEMDEYLHSFTDRNGVGVLNGVRVFIHEQGTAPFPAEGVMLAPGYLHQIGLRIAETSRLGHPYGTCTDGEHYFNKYKLKYTRNTCTEICKMEMLINECGGCALQFSSMLFAIYADLPTCGFNSSVLECIDKFNLEQDRYISRCDCPEPCRTTSYLKTISGTPWPSESEIWIMFESLCYNSTRPSMLQLCEEYWNYHYDVQWYRNNFMKINIYFEDTNYQLLVEEPSYGLVRFLSDIGGTMGLFIGASLVSIVEITQVLMEIMMHLLKRRKVSPKPREQEKNDPMPVEQDGIVSVIEITGDTEKVPHLDVCV